MSAADIDAIDGPFGEFGDLRNDKAYLRQATYATSLGAVGKWCIHPKAGSSLRISSLPSLLSLAIVAMPRLALLTPFSTLTLSVTTPEALK